MYIVSLGFDDGLLRSSLRTAELFERFGLSAGLNVIATGSDPTFEPPDWILKGTLGCGTSCRSAGMKLCPTDTVTRIWVSCPWPRRNC